MKSKIILMCIINMFYLASHAKKIHTTMELPLVISVCAYNNAPWVKKNLDSIFMQKYTNYRVVYIDDASSDNTAQLVQEYIDSHQLQDKIILQVNPVRCKKMKNIYNVFHSCDDHEIIVQVDGDDWLAHDHVFTKLNTIYQKHDVWLTYGQFIGHDGNKAAMCKPVPKHVINNRSFRKWDWTYTHLRTFYAWLFKNLKLEDFINEHVPGYEGTFFPLGNDAASYFSMLEMCGPKFAFIPETLYIYNRANPFLTVKQTADLIMPASRDIRSRPQYPQVKKPILNRLAQYEHAQADLIILSNNTVDTVQELLSSISDKVIGIENIYVLYEKQSKKYKQLEKLYDNLQCISTENSSISMLLTEIVKNSSQHHILITKDDIFVCDTCNLTACIHELEKTFAYGFYLGFSPSDLKPHQHVYQEIYAWKFQCAQPHLCNSLDMTLLRKQTVLERIARLPNTTSIDSCTRHWQKAQHATQHNIGLVYTTKKVSPITSS